MAKHAFEQNGYIVGQVLFAGISDRSSEKTGNTAKSYTMMIKTPEGAALSVKTDIWASREKAWNEKRAAQINGQIATFMDVMSKYKNEKVFVSVNIKPALLGDKKDVVQFNKVSSYSKGEGHRSLKIDLFEQFPTVLDYTEEGENILIQFKDSARGFDGLQTTVRVKMFVDAVFPESILISSGTDDNATTLEFDFDSANAKGTPVVGQGYEFTLGVKKGGALAHSNGDNAFDFDAESKPTGFAPDSFILKKVGKIADWKMEGLDTETPFSF